MNLYETCLPLTYSTIGSFLLVLSGSSIVRPGEKTPVYSTYFPGIFYRTFCCYVTANNRVQKECVSANSCSIISSTPLTINKASMIVYDPQVSFLALNF